MPELSNHIKNNTTNNTKEMQTTISSMVCAKNSPIPLSEDDLLNALKIEGEFFVLKMHYDNFKQEIKEKKIKYKISQSLSIVVSYEDDGNCYEHINKFVKYMDTFLDKKQSLIFGVKKVKKLSTHPITILFSGILPINQLQMSLGKKIYELIHSDDEYFLVRFKQLRDAISKEVGVPILPLFAQHDTSLNDYQVCLKDPLNDKIISNFEVTDNINKENLEPYLIKLFYIYKTLLQQ